MRDDLDLRKYTLVQLDTWIENLRAQGQSARLLYRRLLDRRAELTGQGLNVERSIAHLIAVAREKRFTTYGDLAAASEVPWNRARYAMNGPNGHLDQLLDICHARGLPLLTSICVNRDNLATGNLGEDSLSGYLAGVRRLGIEVRDSEAESFLRTEQRKCFDWAKRQ